MKRPGHGLVRLGALALGLLVALATSGCVAAGVASGPLMSAVQLLADRTVERTVSAELAEAQSATEAVLARMAFKIETREREEGIRRLRAVADGVMVYVKLERVTTRLTRVGLRVEAGKITADRNTSSQIQDQIAAVLTPSPIGPPASDPAAAEAFAKLHAEIRKLRSDIEDRRPSQPAEPLREGTATMRLESQAVVAAPMSAAIPTVGGPAPTVSVAVPAAAMRSPTPSRSFRPAGTQPSIDPDASATLRPVGALTPIEPAMGMGIGK